MIAPKLAALHALPIPSQLPQKPALWVGVDAMLACEGDALDSTLLRREAARMRDAVATGSAATPSIAKTSTRPSYALRHASSLRTTKPRTRYCLQLPHRASISCGHWSHAPRQ